MGLGVPLVRLQVPKPGASTQGGSSVASALRHVNNQRSYCSRRRMISSGMPAVLRHSPRRERERKGGGETRSDRGGRRGDARPGYPLSLLTLKTRGDPPVLLPAAPKFQVQPAPETVSVQERKADLFVHRRLVTVNEFGKTTVQHVKN